MTAGWSVNRLAGQAVALHAGGDLGDRRELLDMLGITEPGSPRILPDDTHLYEILDLNEPPVATEDFRIRAPMRDRTAVPPGLANLPALPKNKPALPATGLKCGTLAGRAQHTRRGEKLCRACKDAQNAYQCEVRARKRAAAPPKPPKLTVVRPKGKKAPTKINPNLPPRPETCGTIAGRANHLRRGEKLCRPCADTYNAQQRTKRRARKSKTATAAPDVEERSA